MNSNEYLQHYGVKGMKWGVRRSPEVQSVNKQYKKELKKLRSEAKKQDIKDYISTRTYGKVFGQRAADRRYGAKKHANVQNLKENKKALQDKYEPAFQEAKKSAEKRLASEIKMKDISPKRLSKGKKIALGVVAGVGASVALDVALNKEWYKNAADIVKTFLKN